MLLLLDANASAVLGVVIVSVHPLHACFVTNLKNLPTILYHMIGQSFSVFCHPTVVSGRPLPDKMCDQSDTRPSPVRKLPTSTDIRL